ncbi:MAG TPA: GNAT family N-acetyltransferase [Caulobacteraceae bacterium]|jgi:RimJ/RimL family protein N-acetyltransferase|nr:GNAT family N-acetyltransferase [Caulobacteraceae bacterium]HEX4097647.1 GNAT family N-acetyltransferase [Caulobacteraceae bacterium]
MDPADYPIRLPESLTDGVLLLDAPTLADAEAHQAGEDDEMRLRFDSLRRATLEETRGAMQRWMDARAAGHPNFAYMARLPGAGLIGGCEIRLVEPDVANVSYWLYPQFRGQGHAARALRLLLAAAPQIAGLARIEAHISPDNLASRRLAERLGFTENGLTEETAWHGGVSTMVRYEMSVGRS